MAEDEAEAKFTDSEKEAKAKKIKKRDEMPSASEIKKLRKAELVDMCRDLGLNSEGKVAELRERLIDYLEEEDLEISEKEYGAKIKPKLDEKTKRQLRIREERKMSRPLFRRQEWFRYVRLGEKWRRPRGLHSKMRRGFKYRPKMVSVGYRGPRLVRGLHHSGFQEVLVYRVEDLENLDPERQAARIGHSVGTKKREEIEKSADEKGIRVLNRSITHES